MKKLLLSAALVSIVGGCGAAETNDATTSNAAVRETTEMRALTDDELGVVLKDKTALPTGLSVTIKLPVHFEEGGSTGYFLDGVLQERSGSATDRTTRCAIERLDSNSTDLRAPKSFAVKTLEIEHYFGLMTDLMLKTNDSALRSIVCFSDRTAPGLTLKQIASAFHSAELGPRIVFEVPK